MRTYLLEKSRITSQLPDEQNYHVLYQVAACLPPEVSKKYEMGAWETFSYLNVRDKKKIEWDQFPTDFKELSAAMASIPTVASHAESVWKVLAAILHLGNAKFKGTGEDDACFDDGPSIAVAARLLGCVTEQLSKAISTLNIKAGLDWIAKPNTTAYSVGAKHALSRALYSRLFDMLVEQINESLMFGGDTRFFIGAVDIFGFECFPRNSLEQLCINFANEKLQRMFTEAVFESVLAEYEKEGIDVGGMTFEDNSEVVKLIEGSPSGLLTLLAEECFFPNGSDIGFLGKIQEIHRGPKSPFFEGNVKESKTSFTVLHYPGRVTYDAIGFLEKNKDPLSQDLKVLMQYSDDEFVAALFADKVVPGGGPSRFKSAKFVGVIDAFRTSLNELVGTLKATKTHFIRCVKPNEKKAANMYVETVMKRQLYTSGVVQAVKATRKGFPDHLMFDELLGRYALILGSGDKKGREGCSALLAKAGVPEAKFRLGKTKAFLGVGMLDMLEQARMEYISKKAVSMQLIARAFLARKELRRRVAERERQKREAEEKARKEEEERARIEEEARKLREAEEAKEAEAAAKAKEAEEKNRQERFRRARQLSFERKTAKKKREEAETKRAEEEAAAAEAEEQALEATKGAVNAARASFGELPLERGKSVQDVGLTEGAQENFAEKLQTFQQDVADGTANDAAMMNVAVVSDIGWKTGQEPTSEDVWAQYDFKCAVSDVLEYAEYLGMDIKEDAHLLWIADEALQAPEPQGWEQRLDPKGGVYYYHPTTGMSLNQHPLDHHYQQFYMQMKAQYDAMYQNNKAALAAPAAAQMAAEPSLSEASTPVSGLAPLENTGPPQKKKSVFGMLSLGSSKKSQGPTEEMYQLTVDLLRQQDGLGIGLTLDNIIVEVEPGGSVAAQGDLRYGDQIVQVDGVPLSGRMLKDVIVPRKMHQLVVRYSRVSTQPASPRRQRSKRIEGDPSAAPRRIEELDVTITRESGTGRLGFGIDQMNTVVEVDPKGPVASKLQVGDKIVAVDGELLNLRKFVEVVGPSVNLNLRIARLRAAQASASSSKSQREKLFGQSRKQKKRASEAAASAIAQTAAAGGSAGPGGQSHSMGKPSNKSAMPALREVKLIKETEDTKIGAVFHRLDDAFDKSFFNVEGSSVQPIIKKVERAAHVSSNSMMPCTHAPMHPAPMPPAPTHSHSLRTVRMRWRAGGPRLDGGDVWSGPRRHRPLGERCVGPLKLPSGRDAAQGAGGLHPRRHLRAASELLTQAANAAGAADDALVRAGSTHRPDGRARGGWRKRSMCKASCCYIVQR